ncbi:MAG: PilZ domain-containing protein [Leptospiraceae bacterium]|nr:PilZ domain-containing protein [Leptospiraceae bacterium]
MAERRKRYKRPISLVIIGALFLLFPVWNYLSICIMSGYPYLRPLYVFSKMDPLVVLIMALSLGVGLGLLLVKRWGWRLLFLFAAALIGYNLWAVISLPDYWVNIMYLVYTVLGLAAAVYFLRPDISTPYMKMYPRGWRFEKRHPVKQQVQINGRAFETRDLSRRGLYVDWADCNLEVGQEVDVEIDGMLLKAGVVRIDSNGAGLAFRYQRPESRKAIKKILAAAASAG